MKIAVMGSAGLLGSNLCLSYRKQGYWVRGYSRSAPRASLNKDDVLASFSPGIHEKPDEFFADDPPDLIINCIANTNLKDCEDNWSRAYDSNVRIATELALLSAKVQAYFIQVSTDHYYHDQKVLHGEEDAICISNNYAKSKYEAEKNVLSVLGCRALVARTNIIGFRGDKVPTFFEWLIQSLQKQMKITLFDDYFTSPLAVQKLGHIMLDCYRHELRGIYNIAARKRIDKFHFGIEVASCFGLDSSCIESGSLAVLNQSSGILRAGSLGLDVSKVEKALGQDMPTVEDSIRQLYSEYLEAHDGSKISN